METKKIFQVLPKILSEVSAIGKNSKNQQQGFMFRGIDDVMNELHGLFGKHGVFIIPEVVDYRVDERTTKSGSVMYATRTTIRFHFVADDGSEIVTTNVGEAMDSGDKGMNKTMSCALKYALMQMFLIPTKDLVDADATTPEETMPKAQPKNVANVLTNIKRCASIAELKELQTKVAGTGRYDDEMKQNGVLFSAFQNRAMELQ